MLCAGGDLIEVLEPLNVSNRQTIMPATVDRWYTYISAANEDAFLRWYRDAQRFRLHPIHDLRRARLLSSDARRIAKRWSSFVLGRARHRRLIIQDPFNVFSTEWFVQRLGYRVVVTVRHPLAVVSSLKRLDWTFDFGDLLSQPALMQDRLEPYRDEMEEAARSPDLIYRGSVLWRVIYGTFVDEALHPSIALVRHEDLSLDPHGEFARLYEWLGLSYDDDASRIVEGSTSSANLTQVPLDNPDHVQLDSRANLQNWRRRLDDDEVERIIETTRPVVERFYPGDELYGVNAPEPSEQR